MPQKCFVCRKTDVRLYRNWGEKLKEQEVYCRAHVPVGDRFVPMIEESGGGTVSFTPSQASAMSRWVARRD
jgi:hypothetical protein